MKKTKSKDFAESSASSGALFKEDMPRKQVFSDLWMNLHEKPPERGRQLEAAEEGGTLMGRLASRMSSRDMIDELDLGPKGRSPTAKQAQVADSSEILKETKEHPSLPKKSIKQIVKDHEVADHENTVPSRMMLGAGLHEQTKDLKALNMSDPIINSNVREGSNMAEQAKNAGNVWNSKTDIKDLPKKWRK